MHLGLKKKKRRKEEKKKRKEKKKKKTGLQRAVSHRETALKTEKLSAAVC